MDLSLNEVLGIIFITVGLLFLVSLFLNAKISSKNKNNYTGMIRNQNELIGKNKKK